MNPIDKPKCPVCKSSISGRKNKVFCTIECKNRHHYVAKLQSSPIQRSSYNKFVKRNYIILLGIFRGNNKEVIAHRNILFEHGFNENEYCHKSRKKNTVVFRIKEFEFTLLKNGYIKISRTNGISTFYDEFIARWKICFPDGFGLKLRRYSDGVIRYFQNIPEKSNNNSTVKSFNNGERIEFLE